MADNNAESDRFKRLANLVAYVLLAWHNRPDYIDPYGKEYRRLYAEVRHVEEGGQPRFDEWANDPSGAFIDEH